MDLKYSVLFLLFISSLGFAQTLHNVEIEPFDFPESAEFLPSGAFQILVDNGRLFTRYRKDAYISVLDFSGTPIHMVGRQGTGPGEFGGGVLGMAVRGEHLFAIAMHRPEYLQHFIGGEYQGGIHLKQGPLSAMKFNSNKFDFSETHIVYPATPKSGHLAFAYPIHKKGEPVPVGELLFDQNDLDVVRYNPAVNDTNWIFDGESWICLFRYFPLIQIYDKDFRIIDSIDLHSISLLSNRLEVMQEKYRVGRVPAESLFSDVTVTKTHYWLMTRDGLLKIDRATKKLMDVYRFKAEGPEFHLTTVDVVPFFWFALLDDNRLVLSSVQKWNRDLWFANLNDRKFDN